MFRKAVPLLLFVLAACAKEEEAPAPVVEVLRVPAECTFVNTAAHTFIDGTVAAADRYSCPKHNKMTCYLYDDGGDNYEMVCEETNPANPQGIPTGCTYLAGSATSTVHNFIGYGLLYSASYSCGTYGDGLSCYYFQHPGNQCNDTNGSAADDCTTYQDDEVHEEVRCVMN